MASDKPKNLVKVGLDAEYKPQVYCLSEKRFTDNAGPYVYYKTAHKGKGRVACKCASCGGNKSTFFSIEKLYTGGFLQFLAPIAAAVLPSLLNKIFG